MKFFEKVTAIFDGFLSLLALLACLLLAFMALSISWEVLLRYFFDRSIIWVTEVNEFLLLFITFLGAAWLLKRDGHVAMDFLSMRLNTKKGAILSIITSSVSAITSLTVVIYGTKVTWESFKQGLYIPTFLEPPKFLILSIIPIGTFLLFIQCLRRTYGAYVTWRSLQDNGQ